MLCGHAMRRSQDHRDFLQDHNSSSLKTRSARKVLNPSLSKAPK
jgi:hypothetical protein